MSRTQPTVASSHPDGRKHTNRIDQVRQTWSKTETERRRDRAAALQLALISKLFPENGKEPKAGSYVSLMY